jgi:hypothetical protein
MEGHKFSDAGAAMSFIQAGNATVTLRSVKTQTRFTYRVREKDGERGAITFVGLLSGPDNEASYSYMGVLKPEGLKRTAKSRVSEDALSWKAFQWTWKKLSEGKMPSELQVWHEGRCGKCGRKLTVPESIEAGIGPECASRSALRSRGIGTSAKHKRPDEVRTSARRAFKSGLI